MRDVIIQGSNIALLDLLNDERKARLLDAICAVIRGNEPTHLDEATDIVFRSIIRDNETVCPITKSSLVLDVIPEDQERNKKKVSPNGDTKEKKERTTSPLMTDDAVLAAFQEWERMRKMIKKPLTDLAKTRAVSKLEKLSGGDTDKAVAILEQSVDHCWQDLYELKTGDAAKQTSPPQRNAKVQTAYGFGTERKETDYNAAAWARIRQQWAEDDAEEGQ